MQPLKIYLDSSDYSTLSKFDLNEVENYVANYLRNRINQGDIECFYSGIHLSEMAPLDPAYASAANRRTDLLTELCGKNALVSQNKLFLAEIKNAIANSDEALNVYSYSGEWYPFDISEILPEAPNLDDQLQDTIAGLTTNRRARRIAAKKYPLEGEARKQLISQIKSGASTVDLSTLIEKYPMRQVDIDVLAQYVVGNASYEKATMAFTYCFQNPIWMMKWFEKHHEKLDSLIEWTRKPGRDMVNSLNSLIDNLKLFHENFPEKHGSPVTVEQWINHQDNLLIRITEQICQKSGVQVDQPLRSEVIDMRCPGLSVGVRSVHSAWKTTFQKNTRTPKPSDFPDALHAVYAPYVDIFRADAFMAPYIKDALKGKNVMVAPKLVQLPKIIEDMLSSR